ncbi:hypothetical protein BC832DRAFT_418514 [Gaertneriomyces semiglobifer]|nr:hypothetical protein BC832DRAFT_418514 [Gaertneriomyces semiglobifer]
MGNSVSSPSEEATGLREQARKEAAFRNESFSQSRAAYAAGRKREAKELSEKGKEHDAKKKLLNRRAAELIFKANNSGRGRTLEEIDLHGLHVKEAIAFLEDHIRKCKRDGTKRVEIITGRGRNSIDGIAKIKPAVQELIERERIRAYPSKTNPGRIIIELDVPQGAVGWFIDSVCNIL